MSCVVQTQHTADWTQGLCSSSPCFLFLTVCVSLPREAHSLTHSCLHQSEHHNEKVLARWKLRSYNSSSGAAPITSPVSAQTKKLVRGANNQGHAHRTGRSLAGLLENCLVWLAREYLACCRPPFLRLFPHEFPLIFLPLFFSKLISKFLLFFHFSKQRQPFSCSNYFRPLLLSLSQFL
jgi:hypothetical protein